MLQLENNENFIINENFKISDKWVVKFKKRWRLSSLKSKVNKNATKTDHNELVSYLEECKNIYNLVGAAARRDENFWKFVNINGSCIGLTGSDNRPVNVNVDPKLGFTVIFISIANGELMKPTVILKGKTDRSLNKINQIDNNLLYKKYSVSGWITKTILMYLLNEISLKSKKEDSVLILDRYPVHMLDEIKEEANKINIKLIYVPTGMT